MLVAADLSPVLVAADLSPVLVAADLSPVLVAADLSPVCAGAWNAIVDAAFADTSFDLTGIYNQPYLESYLGQYPFYFVGAGDRFGGFRGGSGKGNWVWFGPEGTNNVGVEWDYFSHSLSNYWQATFESNVTLHASAALIVNTLGANIAGPITNGNLTAATAIIADGNKILQSSATTSTELGFVHGVTSAIQTQINALPTLAAANTWSGLNVFINTTNSGYGVFATITNAGNYTGATMKLSGLATFVNTTNSGYGTFGTITNGGNYTGATMFLSALLSTVNITNTGYIVSATWTNSGIATFLAGAINNSSSGFQGNGIGLTNLSEVGHGVLLSSSNIDASTGTYFYGTLAANTPFVIQNMGLNQTIHLCITNTTGNFLTTWTGVAFPGGGTGPQVSIGNHADCFTIRSFNGLVMGIIDGQGY